MKGKINKKILIILIQKKNNLLLCLISLILKHYDGIIESDCIRSQERSPQQAFVPKKKDKLKTVLIMNGYNNNSNRCLNNINRHNKPVQELGRT